MDHDHYPPGYPRQILESVKTIAVVGASLKADRPAHYVPMFLKERGYRVIPVNPTLVGQTMFGEKVYASLVDAVRELGEPLEMVDVFRRAEDMGPVVEDAIAAGAKILWMQLGIRNDEAARLAEGAGMTVIMNRCPKIELP